MLRRALLLWLSVRRLTMADQESPMADSPQKLCSIPECVRPQRARGLCGRCYMRARTRGELPASVGRWPERTVEERFWEKVERGKPNAECWPWTAGKTSDGYGEIYIDGQRCAESCIPTMTLIASD